MLAALIAGGLAASAQATPGGKTKVKVLTDGQRKILKNGIRVKVTPKRNKVKLRGQASTYDNLAFTTLTRTKKVKLKGRRSRKVSLKLTRAGEQRIASCQITTLKVRGSGAVRTAELVRDSADCKPGDVDLSDAENCDFIGPQDGALCMMPFPDDYYTVEDPSTETGRRIDFKTAGMPANNAGERIDAEPYNLNDGFSQGQAITLKVPGLDSAAALERSGAVGLARPGDYNLAKQPIVVIDTETGERQPVWSEHDSNASTPAETALIVHPTANFEPGHRYIVAMRNLKTAVGATIEAPAGFRYYRDDLPSDEAPIEAQRDRFDSIFSSLSDAGIRRSNLYLAWDFTVASNENIAGRLLAMRDDALAQLGDTTMNDLQAQGTAPEFTVTSTENFTPSQDPDMARRVQGTFEVPCYLAPNCDVGTPGGTFDLNADQEPIQHGTYTANFNCMIPRSAADGSPDPARPSLYGHGLLGSANEGTSDPQRTLGSRFNIVSCATDEIGLSSADVPLAFTVLQDMGKFPQIGDRLQQGILNEILLGRLMINDAGFASSEAFHVDNTQPIGSTPYVIDPSRLYYNGNSQGAIEGGALAAVSPDVTRASLGVGGMNYSVLLRRSVDFDTYAELAFDPSYGDELSRPLVLSIVQMLWDRGESNGYANAIGDNPALPDTPPTELLMNVGLGDHQVSNFTADAMARTIGAEVRLPIAYKGRWPGVQKAWNVPRIDSYPHRGSALVYWDSGPIRPDPDDPSEEIGTNVPPIPNLPNREGADPHELPRRTVGEQQMVSDFLRPDAQSLITDTCGGSPCYDFTFSGP